MQAARLKSIFPLSGPNQCLGSNSLPAGSTRAFFACMWYPLDRRISDRLSHQRQPLLSTLNLQHDEREGEKMPTE
jgi:hypothetical protein